MLTTIVVGRLSQLLVVPSPLTRGVGCLVNSVGCLLVINTIMR